MPSDNEILLRLRQRVGLDMNQSVHFDVLAQSIEDATNQRLGVNTLKRLFGFNTNKVVPRRSTMDIIARYLGMTDYKMLVNELGEDADISIFSPIDCIDVRDLESGAEVRLTYEPARIFYLTYIGYSNFRATKIIGSKNIMPGDILTITQLAVGHRLVVAHVYRNNFDLGVYEAGRTHGLSSVEIIK